MENGDHYVINSATTLYYLPNSSCSEGSSITLNNTQVVRVYEIAGKWRKSDFYTTGNYNNSNYICHIWNVGQDSLNPNYIVLPAVVIVLCFFSIIFSWFNRMRG